MKQSGKGKDHTPLLEACKLGDAKASADIIDVLCANGASLDCYSELGETPFLVAIRYQNFAALESLIAKLGNDPAKITAYLNKPNERGQTAWTIVSSPEYDRRELGYLPSHIKMLDDIKSLLIKHRATQ